MIKIIAGVYGYKENGIIMPKDKDSEPFSLEPEREAELVSRGVAEYANVIIPDDVQNPDSNDRSEQAEEPDTDSQSNDTDQYQETTQEDNNQNDEVPGADIQEDEDQSAEIKPEKPEYSDKMKLTDLQELAGTYGLDAQNVRTKAEVIKLLDDYFAEDDTETPPAFGAMDPVE